MLIRPVSLPAESIRSEESARLSRAYVCSPVDALARFLQSIDPAELEERPLGQWEAMLQSMPATH